MKFEQLIQEIDSSKKTLWILCGLPYSGKTYVAEQILKNTSVAFVSIDEIFKSRGFDWNINKLPSESEWKEIFDSSYKQAQKTLTDGLSVLYDSTNHTKESRDALRRVAQEVGAEARVVHVDVPVETVWKRWEENKVSNSRPVVDKKLVEETITSFEAPTEDENVLIIGNI